MNENKSKIICLDSETTGFSAGQDEILRQAKEAHIPANCLKFWWDGESDLSPESKQDNLEL